MSPATLPDRATASGPARRRRQPRGGGCDEPPRLFGDEPVAASARAAAPAATPRTAATLADAVADAWNGLAAAAGPVPCLACGAEMGPRWSAGAGVVGGRCAGCGTTIE